MLTIATYHVDTSTDALAKTMHVRHEKWGGSHDMLAMLGTTARWADPNCRLVLLTDLATDVSPDSPFERIRRRREDHRVGIHRMECQAAFLSAQPPGDYVFVDTDVLINRVFIPDCDIGVCSGHIDKPKLNSGVVYVTNPQSGVEWFRSAAEVMRKLAPEQQIWMGDQYAQQVLAFGVEPFRKEAIKWHGHEISVLPSHEWNWSPHPDHTGKDGEHAHIWHLKGPRKKRMREFYNYLERRMKCANSEDRLAETAAA